MLIKKISKTRHLKTKITVICEISVAGKGCFGSLLMGCTQTNQVEGCANGCLRIRWSPS